MSFEIEGTLHKKYDTEKKSERFQAREFVLLVEDGSYPQYIKFQLTQDRCNVIDDAEEGQMIKVHFDLRGREWNGKYFTNLNAWRIEQPSLGGNSGNSGSSGGDSSDGSFPSASDEPQMEMNDELPF